MGGGACSGAEAKVSAHGARESAPPSLGDAAGPGRPDWGGPPPTPAERRLCAGGSGGGTASEAAGAPKPPPLEIAPAGGAADGGGCEKSMKRNEVADILPLPPTCPCCVVVKVVAVVVRGVMPHNTGRCTHCAAHGEVWEHGGVGGGAEECDATGLWPLVNRVCH